MITNEAFDKWNRVKKTLQNGNGVRYFHEGQIWWCSIGQNIGHETYGKGSTFTRPVLIFRKLSSDLFLGVPLTSKAKNGSWYVQFRQNKRITTALLHQVRIFDKKRLRDRIGEIDAKDFQKIICGFRELYLVKNIHPASRRESMGKSQK